MMVEQRSVKAKPKRELKKIHQRFCYRCEEVFWTTSKGSRVVCDKCNKRAEYRKV